MNDFVILRRLDRMERERERDRDYRRGIDKFRRKGIWEMGDINWRCNFKSIIM